MRDGEAKKKINALDILIIVVLIFCVVSIAFRYYKGEKSESYSTDGKYAISFTVNDIRYTTADAFVKGDKVYVAWDDRFIGTFERLDSTNPAAYYATSPKDGVVKVYYPEDTRIDVTGTIISEGYMNDDGFFAGGTYFLAPGKGLTIYTGHLYLDITLGNIVPYAE